MEHFFRPGKMVIFRDHRVPEILGLGFRSNRKVCEIIEVNNDKKVIIKFFLKNKKNEAEVDMIYLTAA